MIKLEHKFLEDRGIVAFAAEASSPDDLHTLDLLCEAVRQGCPMQAAFITSNRLVIHTYNLPERMTKGFPIPSVQTLKAQAPESTEKIINKPQNKV